MRVKRKNDPTLFDNILAIERPGEGDYSLLSKKILECYRRI